MHEELEIETIKASAFRHKMTFFDLDLQKEIDGKNIILFEKFLKNFFF